MVQTILERVELGILSSGPENVYGFMEHPLFAVLCVLCNVSPYLGKPSKSPVTEKFRSGEGGVMGGTPPFR